MQLPKIPHPTWTGIPKKWPTFVSGAQTEQYCKYRWVWGWWSEDRPTATKSATENSLSYFREHEKGNKCVWVLFLRDTHFGNKEWKLFQHKSNVYQVLSGRWENMSSLLMYELCKSTWLNCTETQRVGKAKNNMWVLLALTLVPDFMGFPRSHTR